MKILLFTEIYDCGGIDTFITNLINAWPDQTDSFIIISNFDYPGLKIIESKLNREVHIVKYNIKNYDNFKFEINKLNILKRYLSPIFKYLYMIYVVINLKQILIPLCGDILMIINGGFPAGETCRAASIAWGLFSRKTKSIHNFHNLATKAPWHSMIQENILDLLVSKCTWKFITVSAAAAKSMCLRPVINDRNRVEYIHNGIVEPSLVKARSISIRDEIGITQNTPLCLMLGTYETRKGHYFLLSAFKKVLLNIPNAHLLICGFGFPNEIKLVSKYVNDFELDGCVHLMGFRNDVSNLLVNSDVLVVASQDYESFGFTSIEAMAHKVPVVATNAGGIPEVVIDGYGGYCIDKENVDLYANYISVLLNDSNLRERQGMLGYDRYLSNFSAKTMALKYYNFINEAFNS